jgi:hypothetical protein
MKILFIKSTSLQHLALVFEKVRELPPLNPPTPPFKKGGQGGFEEGRGVVIDVLAHSHALDSLKGFGFINRIITYNANGSFNPFYISIKDIRKEGYDVVVVPFNNVSGAGYENVMALAICIGAGHIVTCNRTGYTESLNFKKALLRVIKGYSYYPLALLMTAALFAVGMIGILLQVISFKLKELFHCSIAPLAYRSNNETMKQ